jgi:hypothetical protein
MSTDKEEKENVTKSTKVKQSTDSSADNESYNRGDVAAIEQKRIELKFINIHNLFLPHILLVYILIFTYWLKPFG